MTNARMLLEQLHDKVEGASWETKRELVQTLVASIVIHTVIKDGKKVPQATIRYKFEGNNPGNPGPGDISHYTQDVSSR